MPLKTRPKAAQKPKKSMKTQPGLGIRFPPKEWRALDRISKQDRRPKVTQIRWLIVAYDQGKLKATRN
jgi:hypothetical protein